MTDDIACQDCGERDWQVSHNKSGDLRVKCRSCGKTLVYGWDDGGNAWMQDFDFPKREGDDDHR